MNKNTKKNEIIIALATPYGKSAVAILRMSGGGCIELAERFLTKKLSVGKLEYNKFEVKSNEKTEFSENLMAVCYKSPKSFTGEDTVELYPHGNMTVCDTIIKYIINGGARLAERGEFTKKAFLNGKLDLMQCEALADIIDAQTAEQLDYGNRRYNGEFDGLYRVKNGLKKSLSTIEAVLHYSDELEENETDESLVKDVFEKISEFVDILKKETDGFAGGKIINDGFKIALIGAPNVGKSTLLNAMIGKDRAIVTDIAGTTRDTIDGEYVYNGRKFVVTDTAGLNGDTKDEVELLGIGRSKKAAEEANLAVFLVSDDNFAAIPSEISKYITVKNKCDGETDVGIEYKKAETGGKLCISAKNDVNITALKQKIYELCPKNFGAICNHRQYACAVKCLDRLTEAGAELKKAEGLEIVAALLYEAYSALAELYGESDPDESIINTVFERFCVGK